MSHHAIPVSRLSSLGLAVLALLFLLAVALHAQDGKPKVGGSCSGNDVAITAAGASEGLICVNGKFERITPGGAHHPAEYKPTEVQSLRLQVKQKDALLAKAALEQAQRSFQQALTDLTNEGERIKLENNWPKDTQFSPNDLTFAPAPSPTAKKEK